MSRTSALALSALLVAAVPLAAQNGGTENGGWPVITGDHGSQRYSSLDQITPQNFQNLEVAWEWNGASFGDVLARPIPIYVDGMLITVAGDRRYVVAIDAGTGETLWTYREPPTFRWEYSMRKNHGKGVAYANVDGRDVVFLVSPAFFLTALDAHTGRPLENWGERVPLPGFPESGVVDLMKPLIADWDPWLEYQRAGHSYDPDQGIPLELGYITSSSPPLVVNGTVVVGNSAEQGYHQSRIENVPGDILAFDASTGDFKWKFHVVPRPGEFGNDTWGNDTWKFAGEISSWAPLSADVERNIVYVPTNSSTIDFFRGWAPGDGLYGTSIIALDVDSGERVWHFQMVHHDIWNYDTSTAPVVMDITVNGRDIPAVTQVGKQAFAYVFNRETGEPVWPIEERPVPEGLIPGEHLSPTQPFPTRPAPYDMQGLPEDQIVDYTPEVRRMALEQLDQYAWGPFFQPPLHRDNDMGKVGALWCPGDVGGTNIDGTPAFDPVNQILYVPSQKGCTTRMMVSGPEAEAQYPHEMTGVTYSDYAVGPGARGPHVQGIPIYKPPYSKITAIDMKTGEHLWWVPIGDTPDRIRNHPLLQGVDVGDTGTGRQAPIIVTPTMLMYAGEGSDGTPYLISIDKQTGMEIGRVEVPRSVRYGMITYMHEGKQHVIVQMNGGIAALSLPD